MAELKKKIKLLIVDDEKDSRDVLVGLLSTDEREIHTAENGLKAKDLLEQELFDLILTDLNMPGMNGLELLRFIKSSQTQALVIMITGYATLENTLAAIEEGAYDYITKPFKLAEMDILVRNACEKIILIREREGLVSQIRESRDKIDNLTKRISTMENRILQLEEREEDLFLGNFDLRLPASRKSLPNGYLQGLGGKKNRELLISKLQEIQKHGDMSEEDFQRYMKKLVKKEPSPRS